MKQIFDWMREQLEELLREPSYRHNGDDFCTGIVDAESILDEAEAKWESECCEWKRGSENKDMLFAPHEQVYAMYESCLPMYPYCPICGKPIKISEVSNGMG